MKYKDFLPSFESLLAASPKEALAERSRYLFLSDLHLGDGGSRDDLAANRALLEAALSRHYLERDYVLVLNGDIEDLSKFRYQEIEAAWGSLYEIFDAFAAQGRLRKIVGNHDLGLLARKKQRYELSHSLLLERGGRRLFAFHGHQASTFFSKHDYLSHFIIRYLAKPLAIRNTSIKDSSRRRFRTEYRIYKASRRLGLVSITGHTHRPLFESLSKYDSLRWAIEELVRDYALAPEHRRKGIAATVTIYRRELSRLKGREARLGLSPSLYDSGSLLVPCLFNSGCATGKLGATAIELEAGQLSLVHWAGRAASRPYLEREELESSFIEGTQFRRHLLRRASLEQVFSRIELLGGGRELRPAETRYEEEDGGDD